MDKRLEEMDNINESATHINMDIGVDSPKSIRHEDSGEEKKEDEEEDEEEEEEEEDRIIEKSPNLRFHKRNKKYMRKVPGIDNSFIAIEPKSGKEVTWNEINLSDKKTEQDNRFINLIKKLKRYNHPFFVRFLDVWMSKTENGGRKIIFVCERLTDPTMKQYFVNSSSSHRLSNKTLWKKFVGQLMSVLRFLNHLGANHGNLSNETVYYQNTGCLKVGIMAVDLNFDNKAANDIREMGKLALEMAAYEASDDSENLQMKDRIAKMLSRVSDQSQYNFIQMCLDYTEGTTTLSKLFQHPVLKELPSLKRLAAKVIVQNSCSINEEGRDETVGKAENQQNPTFASTLKDHVSHFEDETILLKVVFPHDSIVKVRLWKEFRINFVNLPKFIEDVRNGFYPIFEGKYGQAHEDAEEISYTYSFEQEFSKDNVISNAAAVCAALTRDSQIIDNADLVKEMILKHDTEKIVSTEPKADLKSEEVKESKPKQDTTSGTMKLILDVKTDRHQAVAVDKPTGSCNVPMKDNLIADEPKIDGGLVPDGSKQSAVITDENKTNRQTGQFDAGRTDLDGFAEQSAPLQQELLKDTQTTFEDNVENEIDDDVDDEDDGEVKNGGSGRADPYWDYVSPPEKPPVDQALFTGCLYSYIGCGRWQIYVQMWFLEDRLKREVIIQVMEHEWNNDSRIAAMFENSKIISTADKPILERILSFARHNCPLIDGELIPPQQKLANFDAYDLYQRLEHLQMFSKARQLLEKVEQERNQQKPVTGGSPVTAMSCSGTPEINFPPPPTQGQSSGNTPGEVLQSNKLIDESQPNKGNDERSGILKGIKLGDLPGFKMELMDIRILAPLNFSCMYCDNHDYLHSEDLPPYLSSPCYHCREGLAKEAKLSPSMLFDLHQQNFIPWPAFLQVRFNIPPITDSGPLDQVTNSKTLKDLIDYDCKWRGRVPCRCISGLVLPPCVEFPNLYSDDPTDQHNLVVGGGEHLSDNKHHTGVIEPPHPFITGSEAVPDNTGKTAHVHKQTSVFPCVTRHVKGAAITCVHGVTFPSSNQHFYKKTK